MIQSLHIFQNELTDLIKDLNLLKDNCRVGVQKTRHKEYSKFYSVEEGLCFCKDVEGLFCVIGIDHILSEWILFIDSSVESLKAILLHNGNIWPPIPVGHSTHKRKTILMLKFC